MSHAAPFPWGLDRLQEHSLNFTARTHSSHTTFLLEMDLCCDIFCSCYNFWHCEEVSGIALSHFHIAMPYSVDLFNIQYFEWLTIALLLFPLKGEPNLLQRTGVTRQLKWKILKRSDECSTPHFSQNIGAIEIRVPPLCDKGCSSSKNKNRYNINLVFC